MGSCEVLMKGGWAGSRHVGWPTSGALQHTSLSVVTNDF